MLFLKNEYSWDRQNENYDRIYRIQRRLTTENDVSPSSNPILKDLLVSRYPEIEKMVLMHLASDEEKTVGEFLATSAASIYRIHFPRIEIRGYKMTRSSGTGRPGILNVSEL